MIGITSPYQAFLGETQDKFSLSNNHLTTSDPELIAWLDKKEPNWAETQTPCPQPTTDCAVQIQISEEECLALLDLYNSMGGLNWRDNTGWNKTNTPCS